MVNRELCQHCEKRHAEKGKRGLCHRCYWDRSIRDQYPVGNRGRACAGDFTGPAPLPGRPTKALPGTDRKIRVMEKRLGQLVELHHPDDAR